MGLLKFLGIEQKPNKTNKSTKAGAAECPRYFIIKSNINNELTTKKRVPKRT